VILSLATTSKVKELQNQEFKTTSIDDNGYSPIWNQIFEFKVQREEINFLVFKVYDEDRTKSTLLCWNAIPLRALRTGVRSLYMKDKKLDTLKDSALLCSFKFL
jgi:hypothetical protein